MYWNNMGKWARATGHKLEALTYERNSMLAEPSMNFNQSPEQYRTASLRELWKDINGSEDGFEAWMTKTASAYSHTDPKAHRLLPNRP